LQDIKNNEAISVEYLDALHAKNEFSGFCRSESAPTIRRLIRELKSTIAIARALAVMVADLEKGGKDEGSNLQHDKQESHD